MAEKGCSSSFGWGCGIVIVSVFTIILIGSIIESNKKVPQKPDEIIIPQPPTIATDQSKIDNKNKLLIQRKQYAEDLAKVMRATYWPNINMTIKGELNDVLFVSGKGLTDEDVKGMIIGAKTNPDHYKIGLRKIIFTDGNKQWEYIITKSAKLTKEEIFYKKSNTKGSPEFREKVVKELNKTLPDCKLSMGGPNGTVFKIYSKKAINWDDENNDSTLKAKALFIDCLRDAGFKKVSFSDGRQQRNYKID